MAMNEIQLTGICTELAGMMIAYGAEIYRVEDTIDRICRSYGYKNAEIYATPANFIITVKNEQGVPVTDSKSIMGRETNLDRVGRINELSRYICRTTPEADVIYKRIEEIKSRSTYSGRVIFISYFVVGAAFTVFFGGAWLEAVFGGILALMVKLITDRLNKVRASAFLNAVVCSMLISFVAVGISRIGFVPRFDKMIIGASMTLVPGVAMTNCMRDFISGDFISGIYTLTEALLTAVGLAVGAGSAVAAVIKF